MSDDEGRFIQLEHEKKIEIGYFNVNSMGFLPNGDLILVSSPLKDSLKNSKIYCYSVENKPTNTTFWKCSQIHELEFTESLTGYYNVSFYVCQTKLFVLSYDERLMFQWNLLTMTFDKQYFSDHGERVFKIMINKNQTLLSLRIYCN